MRILAANNAGTERGPWELDLHGLHASEAVAALDRRLAGLRPPVGDDAMNAVCGRPYRRPTSSRLAHCYASDCIANAMDPRRDSCVPKSCHHVVQHPARFYQSAVRVSLARVEAGEVSGAGSRPLQPNIARAELEPVPAKAGVRRELRVIVGRGRHSSRFGS